MSLVTYLKIENDDTQSQSILSMLITFAEEAFEDYTGEPADEHENIIMRMVIEDWNKYGSEGIPSFSFGSNVENSLTDYSDGLRRQMRRLKKVKVF